MWIFTIYLYTSNTTGMNHVKISFNCLLMSIHVNLEGDNETCKQLRTRPPGGKVRKRMTENTENLWYFLDQRKPENWGILIPYEGPTKGSGLKINFVKKKRSVWRWVQKRFHVQKHDNYKDKPPQTWLNYDREERQQTTCGYVSKLAHSQTTGESLFCPVNH